ncbi:MAG: hypothetical protein IJH43_02445 [Mogibacterium sp.]|nr:hypothetical protein [Bacillota bacterium]MBQ3291222.1 hypothetical protein [Mogibacterium sp.]
MKKIKRFVALLMITSVVFTITGCASDPGVTSVPDSIYDSSAEDWETADYETVEETVEENDFDISYADGDTMNTYPEYSEHCYMSSRDYGTSRKLTGNIKLLLVFVNDSTSTWSEDEISQFFTGVYRDCDYLVEQAGEWGTYLHFDYGYFNVNVPQDQEGRWFDYLMEDFFYQADHDLEALQNYYENEFNVSDAPLLFVFNREGRSCSYVGSRENCWKTEYPMYYAKSMADEYSITHELMHLYGASDYYYPVIAKETAEKYFHDSTMLIGGREVDDLTAYIIGWTDVLTGTAKGFLDDTSYMTREMIDEGLNKTWEEWS